MYNGVPRTEQCMLACLYLALVSLATLFFHRSATSFDIIDSNNGSSQLKVPSCTVHVPREVFVCCTVLKFILNTCFPYVLRRQPDYLVRKENNSKYYVVNIWTEFDHKRDWCSPKQISLSSICLTIVQHLLFVNLPISQVASSFHYTYEQHP